MTVQEAIEDIKSIKSIVGGKSLEIAIKCMEELEQYMALGTVEELKEAREKQVAKKPKKMEKDAINDLDTWCECSCGAMKKVDADKHKQMYCWKCGQALKWGEEE